MTLKEDGRPLCVWTSTLHAPCPPVAFRTCTFINTHGFPTSCQSVDTAVYHTTFDKKGRDILSARTTIVRHDLILLPSIFPRRYHQGTHRPVVGTGESQSLELTMERKNTQKCRTPERTRELSLYWFIWLDYVRVYISSKVYANHGLE